MLETLYPKIGMNMNKKNTPSQQGKSRRDNQGRFKSGYSGNPGGRIPQKESFAQIIRDYGQETDETGLTHKQLIVKKVFDMALDTPPNLTAVRWLAETSEGKPIIQTVISEERDFDEVIVINSPKIIKQI